MRPTPKYIYIKKFVEYNVSRMKFVSFYLSVFLYYLIISIEIIKCLANESI